MTKCEVCLQKKAPNALKSLDASERYAEYMLLSEGSGLHDVAC